MKLLRYGAKEQEKPGLLDHEGVIRDLSSLTGDFSAETLSADLERLQGVDPTTLPRVPGHSRVGPCVGRVGKFICIGLNYADHAAETGVSVPEEPVIFSTKPRAR